MLDRTIAFGPGEIDIAQRHVVLEVDERLARIVGWRRWPDRCGAGCGADRLDVLPRLAGQERLGLRVPIERGAARLHVQVHHGREPARHRQQVCSEVHRLAGDRRAH